MKRHPQAREFHVRPLQARALATICTGSESASRTLLDLRNADLIEIPHNLIWSLSPLLVLSYSCPSNFCCFFSEANNLSRHWVPLLLDATLSHSDESSTDFIVFHCFCSATLPFKILDESSADWTLR